MDLDIAAMPADEREKLLVAVFSYIQSQGGRLPLPAYWARLATFPTMYHESIEFAPSADGTGWDVLLDRRPADDPFFPNQLGTQGFTIMQRSTLQQLFERHESVELGVEVPIGYRFCGVGATPLTKRDHSFEIIFARVLPCKPATIGDNTHEWVSVTKLNEAPVIPSCRMYVEIAVDVVLRGALPHYREFLGEY